MMTKKISGKPKKTLVQYRRNQESIMCVKPDAFNFSRDVFIQTALDFPWL